MSLLVSPGQSDIFKALGDFLVAVLPAATPVRQGELNRTSEPSQSDYAVMWLLMMPRLATNLDEFADCVFTGSVADDQMTVTAMATGFPGSIGVGQTVFGEDVADGTRVIAQVSGTPGGVGVYEVTGSQTLASRTLAAGQQSVTQTADVTVQVDLHGPAYLANAALVATLFRDGFAYEFFADPDKDYGVTPLYADDPRQTPFVNGEKQYERRTSVDLHLQADFVINLPQQFSDALEATVIDATTYPTA